MTFLCGKVKYLRGLYEVSILLFRLLAAFQLDGGGAGFRTGTSGLKLNFVG